MLTQTITLSFSLSATFNSLWKRQVQTLIEPEPDLAPALSVRPAVLSNPQRSMSSQQAQPSIHPAGQPSSLGSSSQSSRHSPSGQRGPHGLFHPRPLGPWYWRASLGSLGADRSGASRRQCQAQSLHGWCRLCSRAGQGEEEGTLNSSPFSSHCYTVKSTFPFFSAS